MKQKLYLLIRGDPPTESSLAVVESHRETESNRGETQRDRGPSPSRRPTLRERITVFLRRRQPRRETEPFCRGAAERHNRTEGRRRDRGPSPERSPTERERITVVLRRRHARRETEQFRRGATERQNRRFHRTERCFARERERREKRKRRRRDTPLFCPLTPLHVAASKRRLQTTQNKRRLLCDYVFLIFFKSKIIRRNLLRERDKGALTESRSWVNGS